MSKLTLNGAFILEVNSLVRNKTLVDDVDLTNLPTLPIVQLAFAYALRERAKQAVKGLWSRL